MIKTAQSRKLHEGLVVIPTPHVWDNPLVEDVIWYVVMPRSSLKRFEGGEDLSQVPGVYIKNTIEEVTDCMVEEFKNASN